MYSSDTFLTEFNIFSTTDIILNGNNFFLQNKLKYYTKIIFHVKLKKKKQLQGKKPGAELLCNSHSFRLCKAETREKWQSFYKISKWVY